MRSTRVSVAGTYDTIDIAVCTVHLRRQQLWHSEVDDEGPIQSFSHVKYSILVVTKCIGPVSNGKSGHN